MSEDVVRGLEGWLFLGRGSNDFPSFIEGRAHLPEDVIEWWGELLTRRHTTFRQSGIPYVHLFAPEKVTIYPEYFGRPIDSSRGHLAVLAARFPELILDVREPLFRAKRRMLVYPRTDSHWNRVGAYHCYLSASAALGYSPRFDLLDGPVRRVDALLDLGAKLVPPMREQFDQALPWTAVRSYANVLVEFKEDNRVENEVGLHVGSQVTFRNPHASNEGPLVIFGDSFSEYRPGRLTQHFAESFTEVHFLWSSNVDFDYVRRVKPRAVITELSERFATTVPSDEYTADSFARERLNTYLRGRQSVVARVAQAASSHQS